MQHYGEQDSDLWMAWFKYTEWILLVIFSIEFVVKIIAYGKVHKHTHTHVCFRVASHNISH